MRVGIAFVVLFLLFGCDSRKTYRIEVPEETRITASYILTEIEERAAQDPENEWLLEQQLYYCGQLEWPLRCERALNKARQKWGLTERMIDMFVDFYAAQEDYMRLESILNGAVETRERLEVRVRISVEKSPFDSAYLARYEGRYQDVRAHTLLAEMKLKLQDTSGVVRHVMQLMQMDDDLRVLRRYYPLLMEKREYTLVKAILDRQLAIAPEDENLQLDMARLHYQTGKRDTAKMLLRNLPTDASVAQLYEWYRMENQPDSALFYLEMLPALNRDKDLLLSKAKLLEAKGWVTRSLPVYEQTLAMDTTDTELREYVENVRRKVAYLRELREKEQQTPPPNLERKTLGN